MMYDMINNDVIFIYVAFASNRAVAGQNVRVRALSPGPPPWRLYALHWGYKTRYTPSPTPPPHAAAAAATTSPFFPHSPQFLYLLPFCSKIGRLCSMLSSYYDITNLYSENFTICYFSTENKYTVIVVLRQK